MLGTMELGLPTVYNCDCDVCSYFNAIGRTITIVHHGKCISKVNYPSEQTELQRLRDTVSALHDQISEMITERRQ